MEGGCAWWGVTSAVDDGELENPRASAVMRRPSEWQGMRKRVVTRDLQCRDFFKTEHIVVAQATGYRSCARAKGI